MAKLLTLRIDSKIKNSSAYHEIIGEVIKKLSFDYRKAVIFGPFAKEIQCTPKGTQDAIYFQVKINKDQESTFNRYTQKIKEDFKDKITIDTAIEEETLF